MAFSLSWMTSFWWTSFLYQFVREIPWTILFLCIPSCWVRLYWITRWEECRRIQKKMGSHCTHLLNGHQGYGYAIGRWYLLYMNLSRHDEEEGFIRDIWLLATPSSYESLIQPVSETEAKEQKKEQTIFPWTSLTNGNPFSQWMSFVWIRLYEILNSFACGVEEDVFFGVSTTSSLIPPPSKSIVTTNLSEVKHQKKDCMKSFSFVERTGSFTYPFFKRRSVMMPMKTPFPAQKQIIDEILFTFQKQQNVTAVVYGPMGVGKSILGPLLLQMFPEGGAYCSTLKLWQPGDTLSLIYYETEPQQKSPLILVFDEVDTVVDQIQRGIPSHLHVPIMIQNKIGWNKFLDDLHWGLYPYVILLMTSNRPRSYFKKQVDPTMFREGRIDYFFSLESPSKVNIEKCSINDDPYSPVKVDIFGKNTFCVKEIK